MATLDHTSDPANLPPGTLAQLFLTRVAVALSRETYCSVMHTLRQDVEINIRVEQA